MSSPARCCHVLFMAPVPAEGDMPIPAELFDEDGELDLDHIFCSKCRGNESDEVEGLGDMGSRACSRENLSQGKTDSATARRLQ